MKLNNIQNIKITMPNYVYNTMINHCKRKLNNDFIKGETEEGKAYGMISGILHGSNIFLTDVKILLKNMREIGSYKNLMDSTMNEHAHPSSVTPLMKRGWITDPKELLIIAKEVERENKIIIGSYHMHKVQWHHGDMRDTPTKVDHTLGEDTKLIMFIISMVNPEKPIIRAFYEGDVNKEISIKFGDSGALTE